MMRVHLQARSTVPVPGSIRGGVPLTVSIRPANCLAGNYEYQTDSSTLLRLLRRKTDLSELELDHFEVQLLRSKQVRLPAIKLQDDVLEEIGYFID